MRTFRQAAISSPVTRRQLITTIHQHNAICLSRLSSFFLTMTSATVTSSLVVKKQSNNSVARLQRHKIVVLNGQSGSGKSSLINAGVIPRLAENNYLYVYVRDYRDPLQQLRRYFRENSQFSIPADGELSLLQILRALGANPDTRVVMVLDQFERLLVNVDETLRNGFFQADWEMPGKRIVIRGNESGVLVAR